MAALALGVLALIGPLRAALKPGQPFPSLAAAALEGGTLPDLSGKVVLVDFCASWCAPCRASFPVYARLQADYASRGLAIVAVSADERAADFDAFVRKLRPPFPVLRDAAQKLVGEVDVPAMPTSYLLDRSGRVRYVHAGFHSGTTERDLRREIEALLAEGGGS